MATQPSTSTNEIGIFQQLEDYNWDKDKEFQGGLSAILGPNPSPSQIEDLTIRAQCFYLSRKKKVPIDFDSYKTYLQSKPKPHVSSTLLEQQHPVFAVNSTPSSSNPTTTTQISASASTSTAHPTHESDLPPATSITNSPSPATPATPQANSGQAPYPPTFAQIIELITSGAPIPGIIDIPDIVKPELASVSKLPKRRKPWEKDVPEEVIQATTGEGLFGDARDRYIAQEFPEEGSTEQVNKGEKLKDNEKSKEDKKE
ncbi:hypothetical protein BGZ60DRAFT_384263 [Tricladium varicosporioides]|nr:hypothetical protein BGZ60DRAFT_384263 [Hymenoscyphus varicosporioides]